MKKTIFAMIFLACALSVFTQEKKFSAGFGLEFNMDSLYKYAGGISLGFDYHFPANASIGINIVGSLNFNKMSSVEPMVYIRGYLPKFFNRGFFAQFDTGMFVMIDSEEVVPMPLVGIRSGYRLHFGTSFYAEPYARFGYPFAFGFGVIGGLRF